MSEYEDLLRHIKALQERVAHLERCEYVARAGNAQALDSWFPDALLHLPFDGDLPYETMSALVNLYGHQLQRPVVATGGILGRPGMFGKAVQIAESATNLVTNPSFETNVTGWSSDWGDTRAVSTEQAKFGSQSCKVTGAGGAGIGVKYDLAVTPGTTYTISGWLYVSSAGWPVASQSPNLRGYDGAGYGTLLGSSDLVTERDEWVWRSVTVTPTQAILRIIAFSGNANADVYFYLDGVQVEAKAYPTPYCDGSLGQGQAWTGTAHASTSTRTNALLRYPLQVYTPGTGGTIAMWASRCWSDLTSGGGAPRLADSNVANGPIPYLNPTTHLIHVSVGGASFEGYDFTALDHCEWLHFVMTWDITTAYLYVNGEPINSAALTTAVPTLTQLQIGNRSDGLRPFNGYFDDVLVLDRAVSAIEVKRLYEAGQAGYPVVIHNTVPGDWKPMARATSDAGQSIPNASYTIVNYEDVEYDTAGGIVTGASWSYTVRRPGVYRVTAAVLVVTDGAFADNESFTLAVHKNGAVASIIDYRRNIPAGAAYAFDGGSARVSCAIDDTLDVRVYQASGAARTLHTDGTYNYIEIEWVG